MVGELLFIDREREREWEREKGREGKRECQGIWNMGEELCNTTPSSYWHMWSKDGESLERGWFDLMKGVVNHSHV